MYDRFILKVRTFIHWIIHLNLYSNGVILYGVPQVLYAKNISLAKNVRINEGVFLHGAGGIHIDENTTLSYGTALITESYDFSTYNAYIQRHHQSRAITIGKNVWIGAKSIILPGITISDNIIVGAGSIVTKDLTDEYCIYAGNPAKLIKRINKL